MVKISLIITILILCIGLIMMGCPKKPVVKEEPSAQKEEAAKIKAERVAKEKESKTKEEFEKSLVAKRTPGIEGEVFESSLLKDIHFDFDKYDVRPEDMAILRENAALLKKYPNVKVQIEGHCDERGTPAGTLDTDPGARPAHHTFVGSKARRISITDDPPQLETSAPG